MGFFSISFLKYNVESPCMTEILKMSSLLIFSGISSRSEVMSLKARLCLKRSAMTTKYYHCGTAKLSQKSIKWIRHGLSESSIGPTVLMHSNHYTMQF